MCTISIVKRKPANIFVGFLVYQKALESIPHTLVTSTIPFFSLFTHVIRDDAPIVEVEYIGEYIYDSPETKNNDKRANTPKCE